jgi:hypothetical protein
MNANVNLIVVTNFFETAVKVFHVFYKETTTKREITFFLLTVVNDMNHDGVLEVCSVEQLEALLICISWHAGTI